MNDSPRYLDVEDRSQMDEQRMEADLLEDAILYKVEDDLTYNHYAWQRSHWGISAERMAPHYPRADKYEARYQEDLKRLGRAA